MPRLPTADNIQNRVVDSVTGLTLFRHNPDDFLRRYIAVDETWIHLYEVQMHNSRNSGLILQEKPALKMSEVVKSGGKLMATFFGMYAKLSTSTV